MNHSPLFTALKGNNISLKNRLAVAPMTRVTASEDGCASEKMKRYYASLARGGFGLIITEGIYIDRAWSQTYAFQAGLTSTAQVNAWREITDAVHRQEAAIFAQIQHAGALSQGNHYVTETVAPSAIRPKGEQMPFYRGEGQYPLPRELSDSEIEEIITNFADAAARAVHEAGFDGVEIHGANGYLLDQFFTEYSNLRTDRWGGDTAGRMTIGLEVIKAVRARLGADVPVGIRISQGKVNDFVHKWGKGVEDARVIFSLLEKSGVDFIHVTEYEAWEPAFTDDERSLVELAHQYAPSLTLIANGGLHDPGRAEEVMAMGADLIALGRGALANHDWPERVKADQPLNEFDRDILSPIADIKERELNQ